jgi:3-oxoadipate enol-lactonase
VPDAYNGDVRIHFDVVGEGAALLLLPGLGVDVRDVQMLVTALATSQSVVSVDNRGAGRSDTPDEPYSITVMAADAVAVLDAAGIQRASVLGYSMGGRIALELALSAPERVERLVLLATGARAVRTWRRKLLFAITPVLPVGPKPRQPAFAFRRQRAASESYDARERLAAVRAPTLILHGRADRIAPPMLAEELHEGIRTSRLEWYEGGHISPMTRPAAIAESVRTFLGEAPG